MAFPETNLPLAVELSLDGSTWTDVTSDVRYEDKIRITRGRSDWAQQVDHGRCSFSLSNTDGKYSPRNPESPYYGQIGRNTPVRVSVNTGSVALWLPGASLDYARTDDHADLDITGDIDVRFDATLLNWYIGDEALGGGVASQRTELIGKYTASGQQSWLFSTVTEGYLHFEWTENGSTTKSATSTVKLPLDTSARLAVRATLDVDNGAAGHNVTFYTSDSISGTWTQLGDTVTGSGTTSIFSSSAPVRIGDATNILHEEGIGRVHAAQVRNGIGGTIVANPDYTAQTSGTTSFVDSAGRTWTLVGNAEITNRKTRFVGEIATWTPRWDTGGFDVVTQVEAAGVMRRLGQGAVPARSPMLREFTHPVRTAIVAYWPMEDAAEATELASAFEDHPAMRITGSVTPAGYDDFAASDPLPTITTGSLSATVPSYASTGEVAFRIFVEVPAAGVVSTQRLISFKQTGTATTWSLYVNTSGNLDLRAYNLEGTQILSTGFLAYGINGVQASLGLEIVQDGADIDYTIFLYNIDDSTLDAADTTSTSGTLAGYTVGSVTNVYFGEDGAMNGTAIGHVALANDTTAYGGTAGALLGWEGETAASRVRRLGYEEDIHSYPTAPGDEACGVQERSTVLELMRAADAVDGGILAEQRDILGICHVQRTSLYSQPVTLTLDYIGSDGLVTPLDPVDDDQSVTNDVTVARSGGSSARAVLDTGTLSTQAPPDGIGLYDTAYTLNLLDDTQPAYHAGWRLHLGTWDETRFPQVNVNLASAPAQIEAAAAVDTGSRIQITNPPVWLPPDTLDLLVQGYSEVLDQRSWTITYNCSPYGPWNVTVEGSGSYDRADASGSTLTSGITSSATSVSVTTATGHALWVDSVNHASEFPFTARVDGETMTVTACTSGLKDAFGRSVTDGWGSADIGGTWTNSGGAAADFDVTGSVGTHTVATVNVRRISLLTAPSATFDIYADTTTSATATGGSLFSMVAARYTDVNNQYFTRLEFTTANAITMTIRERVSGVETQLGTYSVPFTHTPGSYVRIRFQGAGTTLRARVWQVGSAEPDLWHITVTDSSLSSAGSVGLWSIAASANTNVNPVISFDNFDLINPQTFTVTRSVNGVTKAHAAGTDVRLAQPARAAL
ncbi:hypothetical protein K4749_01395 [Streptomyces sp. TRM72054]|uniref:hypothetical protein n=1 Tax=Streptomyces sp. TRM72054 TaxID=2870562 RepID=UPI001C8BEC2C|nr:hypothetical protein [Streptomyces sp. TRM72054]MBX9392286.1 hypothetical protein [Streptomyces sp. TRM72054]